MSGAVTELVAQGVQDTYLTGDPQMSFFRQVYKRHTNFALESVRQIFKGQPAAGSMTAITLKRSGDLVNGMYLCHDATPAGATSNAIATYVDRFELYIGGQKIDEYTGNATAVFCQSGISRKTGGGSGELPFATARLFCPLQFFCCEDSNSPLPLVALQYHDVEIRIHWNASVDDTVANLAFYANYSYLDTMERNVFAQNKQELLITQHQHVSWVGGAATPIIDLPFSHPVKVLTITGQQLNEPTGLVLEQATLDNRMTLELNGQERFEPQNSTFL